MQQRERMPGNQLPARGRPGKAAVRRIEKPDRGALEKADEGHAGQESSDMGKPGHAPSPSCGGERAVDELKDEPETQNKSGRNGHYMHEEPERDQNLDTGLGKQQQVGPQHPGDRPARPDHRDH